MNYLEFAFDILKVAFDILKESFNSLFYPKFFKPYLTILISALIISLIFYSNSLYIDFFGSNIGNSHLDFLFSFSPLFYSVICIVTVVIKETCERNKISSIVNFKFQSILSGIFKSTVLNFLQSILFGFGVNFFMCLLITLPILFILLISVFILTLITNNYNIIHMIIIFEIYFMNFILSYWMINGCIPEDAKY